MIAKFAKNYSVFVYIGVVDFYSSKQNADDADLIDYHGLGKLRLCVLARDFFSVA